MTVGLGGGFASEKHDRIDATHERIMDEIRTASRTGGEKGVKPERYDLIPVKALAMLARVFGYGVEKYKTSDYEGPKDSNWRKGYEWSKNYAAMRRHEELFWGGENLDEESGLPHMAHAAWHALVLLEYLENYEIYGEFDDRA